MDFPSADLFDLFMKLLPGLLAAEVVHALTPHPKRDMFERVVSALIFTLFAQLLVAAIRAACIWVGAIGYSFVAWTVEADLACGAASGLVLGVVWAYVINSGMIHDYLRKLKVTRKTSLPTQWYSAFSGYNRYIILHLKDGRRLRGWPLEWPDEPESGHFLLEQPAWVMDDGTDVEMDQVEIFLVSAVEVEAVEFLYFSDSAVLAGKPKKFSMESSMTVLAQT